MHISHSSSLILQCTRASLRRIKGSVTISPMARKSSGVCISVVYNESVTLREAIQQFYSEGKAIGHFNFSDSNQLKAIAGAAKETGLPVIAGLSEGEREFFPIAHARALVDIYRESGVELFLNADHTYRTDKVESAIAAGVDSVVVDGAK